MKINTIRLKKWDFKQRLVEIERRLRDIDDYSTLMPVQVLDKLDEINTIVDYWKRHMKGRSDEDAGDVKIVHKKAKKPVNLWDS